MKIIRKGFAVILTIIFCSSCIGTSQEKSTFKSDNMLIRISEIKIAPKYLDEYISILKEESEASVRLEPGVIAIYPMFQKEDSTEIRILEIYADKKAYESHLQTPHFKHYKATTLKMVDSLKLVDMEAIVEGTMPQIFKKIGQKETDSKK